MDILLKRRQMMMDLIPYQQIEYLESSGTQYIDTRININDINFEVEAKFVGTENQNSFQTILGITEENNIYGVVFGFGSSGKIYTQLGDSRSYVYSSVMPIDVHTYNTNLKNGILSISNDGGNINTIIKSGNVAKSSSMYMFARHIYNSAVAYYTKVKIYYLKIWNDEVLVRNFIPVRVGNVGYMYDIVSKQLFGNAGTGDFILGPDK